MVELVSLNFDHEKQAFELVVLVDEKEIQSTIVLEEVHNGIYRVQLGVPMIDELDPDNLYVLRKIIGATYKGHVVELPILLNLTDGLSVLPEDYR